MNYINYNQEMEALEKERQYLINHEQYEAENVLVHHAINVISEMPVVRIPDLELLKEPEKSIPVSWLKEKLDGHPELPYAVTDGINNVLDLWEGSAK